MQTYLDPRRQYWGEQDMTKYKAAALAYDKWMSEL